MSDQPTRILCAALTASGQPCKKYAQPGSVYCSVHRLQSENESTPEPAFASDVPGNGHGSPDEISSPEQVSELEYETGYSTAETTEAEQKNEAEMRAELSAKLDELIERVQKITPGYKAPPFSPSRLLELIEENFAKLTPEMSLGILNKLRSSLNGDLFDIDTWKGIWYMLNYSMDYGSEILKRRLSGEYEIDEWGLDQEYLDAVMPFFEFLYTKYWRVETSGLENIPESGRALLVSNHSGQLPWDGAMIALAIKKEHPSQRLVRSLYATWFNTLPFFSQMLIKCGQVLATEDNGVRLLENDELVAVFPEGYKGVGKLYKERYRLARFGRGGFVKMALKTQAPIIPVAVVGAEETYISLAKVPSIARLIHFPYFPISTTFPWFGLLGFVPLPTKWTIDFGEPIMMDGYEAGSDANLVLVSQLTDQVRNVVQSMILTRLGERRSVFFG